MESLTSDPVLGHITTFGGHPLSCAPALAALKVLFKKKLSETVRPKEELFRKLLSHDRIINLRSQGLLIALEFESAGVAKIVVDKCIQKGLLTDWFLFAPHCMRIAPPLTISEKEITTACEIILQAIEEV